MKISKKLLAASLAGVMMITAIPVSITDVKAANPIVQDNYTADPAPMVCSDGRLYVYTSHDEDVTVNGFFSMNDWKCYSTTDMINWTDHGTVLSYENFEWAKDNSSWACQCIERDGKFYMYVPINAKNGQTAIGVAVADSPTGPFEDPIGKPLVGPAPNYIDPTVWVDKDGQAYLYWGNPDLCCVKLNDDMISYDETLNEDGFVNGIKRWELETNDFPELKNVTNDGGQIANGDYADDVSDACKAAQAEFGVGIRVDKGKVRRPTLYEEGPWFFGRNDKYYMVYAANGIPERIDYSMSDSPLGPWEYKGVILEENFEDGKGTGSFTNHSGIAEYKGHAYIFYHTGRLFEGGGYKRSVAVEEIKFNEDGTIDTVPMTSDGVEPIDVLNPYTKVEAETIEYSNSLKADKKKDPLGKYGVEKAQNEIAGKEVWLTDIDNDDYTSVKNVDFTDYGAVSFTARVKVDASKGQTGGMIKVCMDEADGDVIAEVEVKDSCTEWTEIKVDTDKNEVKGTHDLYFVFSGNDGDKLFDFDSWSFTQMEIPATSTPVPSPTPVVSPSSAPVQNTLAPAQTPSVNTDVKELGKVNITSKKAANKKITLKWKKVAGAKGYEVRYTTNKTFKKSVKKITTAKTSITIKKLKKGKTYYVKVAAYNVKNNKKNYGKFSTTVRIKAK